MTNNPIIPLSTFIMVAELKSFRLAAEQLNITRPSVSARIQQLERKIGMRLLNRTTRSVSLTPEGQRLLGGAKVALSELARVTNELKDEATLKTGRVSFATVESLGGGCLPRLLSEFRKMRPGITIITRDAYAGAVIGMVRAGEADLGLTSISQQYRDLRFEALRRVEWLVAAPAHYFAVSRRSISLVDVAQHPLILPPVGTETRKVLDSIFAQARLEMDVASELHSVPLVLSMIADGFGIGFIPENMSHLNVRNRCRLYRLKPNPIYRTYGICTSVNRALSPAAEAFRQFILAKLSD